MPSWSPNDADIAFVSTRDGERHVWAVPAAGGAERQIASSTGRVDAASWGPGGQIVLHALEGALEPARARRRVDHRHRERVSVPSELGAARPSSSTPPTARSGAATVGGASFTDVPFTATLQATPARYTRVARDFDSRAPRKVLGMVRPVISPDGVEGGVCRRRRHLGDAGRRRRREHHQGSLPRHRPGVVARRHQAGLLVGQGRRSCCSCGFATWPPARIASSPGSPPSRRARPGRPTARRIAFFDVDGMWRRAPVSVVDVATGAVTRIHDSLFSPGTPTWSPDGARVAVAWCRPTRRGSARAPTRC